MMNAGIINFREALFNGKETINAGDEAGSSGGAVWSFAGNLPAGT